MKLFQVATRPASLIVQGNP